MFPIHDLRGEPAGFGGRLLSGEGAKYLNSPESAIYHKSSLLYGLDRARPAIARSGRSVVVEGYTDVIALHQAGIPEAVATCGTALTDEHFDLLRRFSDRVVLAFDADIAGAEAARRTSDLEAPVRLDLDMRVAIMPDGGDPADMVQAGRTEEVRRVIEEARPLMQFRLEREVEKLDLSEPEARARALHSAAAQVARISDPIARREYQRFVARLVGVDLETVAAAVGRGRHPANGRRSGPGRSTPRRRLEEDLLRLMVANPAGADQVTPDLFQSPDLRQAAEAIAGARGAAGEEVELGSLQAPPETKNMLIGLMVAGEKPDSDALLAKAASMRIDAEIDRLEAEIADTDPADEGYSQAFSRLIALQQERRRR